MEQSTVNQRVEKLVEYFSQGNKSAFAKSIGVSSQGLGEILGGRQSAPSFSLLQKLSIAYPQVRMPWLISGEEPMLNSDVQELSVMKQADSSQLVAEAASINNELEEIRKVLSSMELSRLTLQEELKTAERLLDQGTQIPELQEQYMHRVQLARKLLQVSRRQIGAVHEAVMKQHARLGHIHSQIAHALKAQAAQAEASKQDDNEAMYGYSE